MKSITVQELHQLSQTCTVELIDVRTEQEFREVHAALAQNVPLDSIDPHELMRTRRLPADEPMYFICHLGNRSGMICAALAAAGYSDVVNVEGGMEAWEAAALPVEQG